MFVYLHCDLSMTQRQYKTMTFNADFGYKQYITPANHCDPKRQILMRTYQDLSQKKRQGKFKVTTKPITRFMEEIVKQTKDNPASNRYEVSKDILRRVKSSILNKIDPKSKRGSYIDDVQRYDALHKPPGVGKFDLTKYSDIGKKRASSVKQNKQIIKFNNFDDGIKVAAGLPGPGQFNPHKEVQKLKVDRTDHKFWKSKHAKEDKARARSLTTKMGPSKYEPIMAGTFESIKKQKQRSRSVWQIVDVDIRKGLRSQMLEPAPSLYNTMHQWIPSAKKESNIGHFNLLNRVCSARTVGVYR